jgi:VanZ family protein
MPRYALAALLWLGLTAWAAGILWISSMTRQELPESAFLFSDKFNHFVAFAAGGWLAASALRATSPRFAITNCLLLAVTLLAIFGAIDETLQKFTPGRTGGSIGDWGADVLGAAAGALASTLTRRHPMGR